MKNLATIKQLRSDVFKARSAYHQAIIQNLQEIGEELPVSSGYEDEDEPKGCRVTSINQNNDEAFQAVVCGICYDEQKEPICKVAIHVIEWDGDQSEQWLGLTDLDESAADYVLESIQWPESMSQGEAETAKSCKSDDSLNDFIQQGDGEALVTQVNGKPVEPKKSETFFGSKDFDIELFAQVLAGIYSVYYNSCDYGEEYTNMIWKGISLSQDKENKPLVEALAHCRQDLLTSDRELASFAATYEIFNKRFSAK
jgi:hypothetical protein